jgi:hypothetical protein
MSDKLTSGSVPGAFTGSSGWSETLGQMEMCGLTASDPVGGLCHDAACLSSSTGRSGDRD